jgi:hypothetical protein
MRKEVRFICDICGYRHGTAEDANLCESNHLVGLKIVKSNYVTNFIPNFPISIEVESREGIRRTYIPGNSDLITVKED